MKKLTFAATCCMAMLAGCQQAEEIVNPSEELIMSIEASIGDAARSRYASNNDKGTPYSLKFVEGDKIGVFVDDRAAVTEWTKTSNEDWSTTPNPVYWPGKGSEGYDFYAFYPYPSENNVISRTSVPMPSLEGQDGTISSISARDFMVATTHKAYTDNNGKVSFTGPNDCFKHVSSLVAITILKESDLKESTIHKISFEGTKTNLGSLTSYSFENKDSPVTVTTSIDNVVSAENFQISMAEETEDKTLYFILNSGANLSNVTFSIEYQTGLKSYIATKTGLGEGTLTSGNRYNFKLNITDGVLSITGNEIQGWGEGTNMEDIIINKPQENSNNETD